MDPRSTHSPARDPATPEEREELVRGKKPHAALSLPEHGDPHLCLDVALGTHVKPGFATDTCIRREGIDPATGHRYLEEMAFEVVDSQRLSDVTARAEELSARGVRRIFAVFTRKRVVREWRDGDWEPLSDDAHIQDDCLAAPLPVEALLRASALGAAAVRGLARGEPELKRLLAEREAEGRAREALVARRATLRLQLEGRRVTTDAADEARFDACEDTATLDGWIVRAANATGRAQVFD